MRFIYLLVGAVVLAHPAMAQIIWGGGNFPLNITPPIPPAAIGGVTPCGQMAGDCAEAWDLDRRAKSGYAGYLFQLKRSDGTTLNVGMQANGTVDLSTWSAFCSAVQSNCVYSKIYAQVNTGSSNDLVPSVYNAAGGANCTGGAWNTCSAPFVLESATGLPIANLDQTNTAVYTLASDGNATGINAQGTNESVIVNGQNIATQTACCGFFGTFHAHSAADISGTDFGMVWAYGQYGGSGADCSTVSTYCLGIDNEIGGQGGDFAIGGTPPTNLIGLIEFTAYTSLESGTLNGQLIFGPAASSAPSVISGQAIHLGAGGDLSQPAKANLREMFISNYAITAADYTAVACNMANFFSSLSYPDLVCSGATFGASRMMMGVGQ